MSLQYPKIQTLWKRESEKPCNMRVGDFSTPEFEALYSTDCWLLTEKVDGTNIRVTYNPEGTLAHRPPFQSEPRVRVQGKTDRAQTPDFLREAIDELLPLEKFADFDCQLTLYGEGYGPKIQKGGGRYRTDASFVLFDVMIGDYWLRWDDVVDVANKLGVDTVPVVARHRSLLHMEDLVSEGIRSDWDDFEAEGLVARTEPELRDRRGRRILTKLKTEDYRKLDERKEDELSTRQAA